MGLDMYLSGQRYVKNWDHDAPSERHEVVVEKGGKPVQSPFPIAYVKYEAGYWRKANEIHNWFVKNVQDGVDDCGEYYVSAEQLQELLDTVNKVLKSRDPAVASSLLPTTSGSFFGSTEYSEYYWESLERTKTILENALAQKELTYTYQSSW